MQERARRKLATPDKLVQELTSAKAKTACNREDNNYCVVAFYSNDKAKAEAQRKFEAALLKYKDDPVTFFTVSKAALKPDCPVDPLSPDNLALYVFRTKRRKYDLVEDDVLAKIDTVLSGSPLSGSMTSDFADCFV